jgi:ABC-2 type transport system ATP-binding protein
VKRRVGYLPDSVGFYDNLTARANMRYVARLAGIPRQEQASRIADALRRVRLEDVALRRAGTFSHGMRKRLGLAEVWLKRARVAILDEPTSGLDPQSTNELLDMIRRLKADGVAVLLSSHLLDRVQAICDRVALFNRGKVALLGSVPELAREVLGGATIIELEAHGADLARPLAAVPGVRQVDGNGTDGYRVVADSDVRGGIAAAIVAQGGTLTRLGLEQPSLDAIYTRYFKERANAA